MEKMETEVLLHLDNISRTYHKGKKEIKALKTLDLSLHCGEKLGIVGESGSGKTTLLKQICGIEKPDSGRIMYRGKEIDPTDRKTQKVLYKNMQMIFQNAYGSFNPRRRIKTSMEENLRFLAGITDKKKQKEIMVQYMKKVELDEEHLFRYPGELSGGQCQRAAIARALMVEPEILLCDEVTSALDVIVQDKIMELLKKLSEELHIAILFVSHDLAIVSGFCDNVMVMKNGECIEKGECTNVLISPQHSYTKKLLDSVMTVPDVDEIKPL